MTSLTLLASIESAAYGTDGGEAAAATLLIISVLTIVLTAIAYVISSFLLMRIFKKAGLESWKAWVPVYNTWVSLELGRQPGFWAILTFIPFINIVAAVFLYIAYYRIGLSLGKSGAFVLLAIFLPIVWLAWLAFDASTWEGSTPTDDSQPPAFTPPAFTPPTPPSNI